MTEEPKHTAGRLPVESADTVEGLRGQVARLTEHLRHLTDIGLALSGEQNRDRLLEMIVDLARSITGADAGILYIVDDAAKHLDWVVMQNDTTRSSTARAIPIILAGRICRCRHASLPWPTCSRPHRQDRPYKEPMKLSEAMKIMGFMVKDKHVDPEVFGLFQSAGVYKDYAAAHLSPSQIDDAPPFRTEQTGNA
ncbi:MAG: hypothetical protein P4L39_09240 [Humidesulfovibrio sp.]|nr:hypothetical protein [Humidesulfovibrio sp.]